MIKSLQDAQERINKGFSLFSSSGHPTHGLELDQVSHLCTKLFLEGDECWARVAILPTVKGRNAAAIIRGGGRLGVSGRGQGKVVSENGKEIVEDYDFEGVDFCLSPASGIWVGKEALMESAPLELDNALLPEEILFVRFQNARRDAAFTGTWDNYLKASSRKRE